MRSGPGMALAWHRYWKVTYSRNAMLRWRVRLPAAGSWGLPPRVEASTGRHGLTVSPKRREGHHAAPIYHPGTALVVRDVHDHLHGSGEREHRGDRIRQRVSFVEYADRAGLFSVCLSLPDLPGHRRLGR